MLLSSFPIHHLARFPSHTRARIHTPVLLVVAHHQVAQAQQTDINLVLVTSLVQVVHRLYQGHNIRGLFP